MTKRFYLLVYRAMDGNYYDAQGHEPLYKTKRGAVLAAKEIKVMEPQVVSVEVKTK